MSNLDIWDKLGKTDPAHTKGFKRAGGFGGTAIKPIYTTKKMTEEFGPAGLGWGMGEPTFQTVAGSEGQVAVYCTVELWWTNGSSRNSVYGVGGDMVVVKQSSGLRTDDEAFKKAFTDAMGNAMKHLGMSADVHMGLFDDSKYVQEMREEAKASSRPSAQPEPQKPAPAPSQAAPIDDEATLYARLSKANANCATKADFNRTWSAPNIIAAQAQLSVENHARLETEKARKFAELEEKEPSNYQAPNFDNLPADTQNAIDNLRAG